MKTVSVIDESFDSNVTSTYQLSIMAGLSDFSFCILDTIRMKFLALKSFEFDEALTIDQFQGQIRQIFHTEGYLIKNYKSIHLAWASDKSALVPAPLFHPDNLGAYISFSPPPNDQDELMSARIPIIDAHVVYTIPAAIKAEFTNNFEGIRFLHPACPLIADALINTRGSGQTTRVHLHMHRQYVDLAALNGPQLQLFNSFVFKSNEDLLFFVLYAFDQLEMNQEETTLWISGFCHPDDAIVNQLRRYIRKVAFCELNRSFSYSYTFNELTQHHYAQLINLSRCES